MSPLIDRRNLLSIITSRYLSQLTNLDNSTLFFWLSVFAGGVVVPTISYINHAPGEYPSFLSLAFLGVSSTLIFIAVYSMLWLLRNCNRYVVTQFEVAGSEDRYNENSKTTKVNPELEAIANLITEMLVEELQQISVLLKQRQVENVNLTPGDNNAFFVTSGFDQEFINEMYQIVTIDVGNAGKISLGRILLLALRMMARIRVKGRVQQRTNGTIGIWVELRFRNNQSAAVDFMILPENSISEIDQVFMRPVARELSLKLVIKLGQLIHLGSNWQSLGQFLRGLEASSRRDWWQAISCYREAIELERGYRTTFGVGQYHLGAALILQGNNEQGLHTPLQSRE